ncbi:MAG: hypothetical protein U0412_04615 [Nitrospira sp.]|mgnify:CR=1 FL=1
MRPGLPSAILLCLLIMGPGQTVFGGEAVTGVGPIHRLSLSQWASILPPDILVLDDPSSIEGFLDELESHPPDWATVYGQGHHDPGHDERLFNLNRERDERRAGHSVLQRRIAFRWTGELSRFDPETGGFSIALGPVVSPTKWGQVRFKPEDLPGDLRAVPSPDHLADLRRTLADGHGVELTVVFVGHLIPDESVVYDFSHDQDGLGLIMPFVRVEAIHYLLSS